jgi:hypothetical protein
MLKIVRRVEKNFALFILSGRIEAANLEQLDSLLKTERQAKVINLKEVSLVDSEAVKFLECWETLGAVLQYCPPFIREWIAAERNHPL